MLHPCLHTEIALGSVLPLKAASNFSHVPEALSKLAHRCWIGNGGH